MVLSQPSPPKSVPPVADALPDNWVDSHAPESWRPYLRLARLDRPIGVWLLLFPCWWSVALAGMELGHPLPSLWYLTLFAVGALVMRSAGCAYNDVIDRNYDAQVARTANRPIPSGQVSVPAALVFAAALSLVGLLVLVQLNVFTILLGTASLLVVAVYPFAKRFTYWPQVILGLAFNWGALVGWTAIRGSLDLPAVLLYAGAVLWTVGYDTIYAHQDKDEDEALGLKSTALRFGDSTKTWVGAFYVGAVVLWGLAGFLAGAHLVYVLAMALVGLQMSWQVTTLDITDGRNCLRRFRSNRDVGIAVFLGLSADMLVSWLASLV